jgi:thiamine monophosphate kinase
MQLQLLAPALRHFCADMGLPAERVPTQAEAARLRPRLRSGMLAAIDARLHQAIDAADGLASGEYLALLQAAPRHIVRAMLDGAP